MKAVFAGFLAGVAAVLVAGAILGRTRTQGAEQSGAEASSTTGAPVEGGAAPGSGEAAALRSRAATLRAENARLAAAIDALRRNPAGTGAGQPRKRRPRAEFGASVLGGGGYEIELTLFEGEIADRDGVTPFEARESPEVLEELLVGMRESCKEPLGEAESKALQDALEVYRPEWERWRSTRDSAMSFDRAADLMEMQVKVREAMFSALSPETAGRIRDGMEKLDLFERTLSADVTVTSRDTLAARWISDLGLDPATVAALSPAAGEYMSEQAAFQKVRGRGTGAPGSRILQESIVQARILAKAQARIRDLGGLTNEQQARLASWWNAYDVEAPDGEDRR